VIRSGNLFVISGPSGAGKGTLVSCALKRIPDAWVSVSATTRPPRPGEVDGIHYYFMDDTEFDRMIAADGFLEWAHVHTARYGTLRRSVEEHIARGEQVILEIDVQGGFQVKDKMPECHLVFIEPPSLDELHVRLVHRGTEPEDVIAARMKVAELELSQKMKYDIRLVNDNLEEAANQLVAYIESQATKNRRNERT
jgi:guanylate kinase